MCNFIGTNNNYLSIYDANCNKMNLVISTYIIISN